LQKILFGVKTWFLTKRLGKFILKISLNDWLQRPYLQHNIFFVAYEWHNKLEYLLLEGLVASKAGTFPSEAPYRLTLCGRLLALPTNIILA